MNISSVDGSLFPDLYCMVAPSGIKSSERLTDNP